MGEILARKLEILEDILASDSGVQRLSVAQVDKVVSRLMGKDFFQAEQSFRVVLF